MPDALGPLAPEKEESKFVLETDEAPEFWQFLNGLRGDDLLVELIVNDLDAHSPATEIRFEPARLVCAGEGDPIDENGWKRLRKMRGAGYSVPAKQGLFGIKNHGLKACFTLGNDIVVRSAGRKILQTLFSHGPDEPAYPGVRVPPAADPDGPAKGTVIEVPYRQSPFRVTQGEPFEFAARDEKSIEGTFVEAAKTLPRRLLGIIRPFVLETYTLRLVHHRLGVVTLEYRCGRPAIRAGLMTFGRRCKAFATDGIDAPSVFERSALMSAHVHTEVQHPIFFRSESYLIRNGKPVFGSDGLVLEAAWPVDSAGRLQHQIGSLRYPVAYPADTADARTDLGFHFSAPFSSDAERHELGPQSKAWNSKLIGECDRLACRALSELLLPKFGPDALRLVSGTGDADRLTRITTELLKSRSIPATDCEGRATTVRRGARLLIPAYTWDLKAWAKPLAQVCPLGSTIIDPRTPARMVELLSEGKCEGVNVTYIRFDEQDVLQRMQSPNAEYFPWPSEAAWRKALGDHRRAADYLDALHAYLSRLDEPSRRKRTDVMLPDGAGRLHTLATLKRGVFLPAGLTDIDPPPVLHPSLKDHPVFRLKGWIPDSYSFRDLLLAGAIENLSQSGRRRFFGWLSQNANQVARDDWPSVKELPVWPSTSGAVVPFEQLCQPKSAKLASLMREHLTEPTREVRSFCASVGTTRVRLNIRSAPSAAEVTNFYRARLSEFECGIVLSGPERARFKAFEAELGLIGAERRLAIALRQLRGEAIAVNHAGVLAPLGTMVRASPEVMRLLLLPEMILDRDTTRLDRIFAALAQPTWRMVADSIRQDPTNGPVLIPRLKALVADTNDPSERRSVTDVPCIPVAGVFIAPADLAFKGNTDYWGDRWKTRIGGAGLPDDVQDLYRAVGVMRSVPDPETTRAFFGWLSEQNQTVLAEHVPQIVRHIGLSKAVSACWLTAPEVPCIPVESQNAIVLLTASEARKQTYIDDFAELAEEIRSASPPYPVSIAIHSARLSRTPIAEHLHAIGIPRLRTAARGPLKAIVGSELEAPEGFRALLLRLQSEASARQLRKQLQELDVSLSWLEQRWQYRLAAIQKIRVGTDLRAEYRIGRRAFSPRSRWAVLIDQKELWLDADQDLHNAFFGAVADLIFTKDRPRFMPAVLKAALDAEVREFHRPAGDDRREDDADGETTSPEETEDGEVGESGRPHPGGPPAPDRKPNPAPLHRGGSGRIWKPTTGGGGGRPQVEDEDIQRRELKEDHYAWHCQIDLATSGPQTLAPAGSYVEYQENRQKVVEAHHPDKVGPGGARHAGNLLILSHLNHERFGKAISRQQITDALLQDCAPRKILATNGSLWVAGVIAQVLVPSTGDKVAIFFTREHRRYWLEMAGHKEPPSSELAQASPRSRGSVAAKSVISV